MRIDSVQIEASGRVSIATGGFFFVFMDARCRDAGIDPCELACGRDISDGTLELFSRMAEEFACSACARSLAARAEQTERGLSDKLLARGHSGTVVRTTVASLVREGLVDDGRFARAYILSRIAAGAEGPVSLLAALVRRGVSREAARRAIGISMRGPCRTEALATAVVRLRRRFGQDRDRFRSELVKLGYSPAEAAGAIEGMDDEAGGQART